MRVFGQIIQFVEIEPVEGILVLLCFDRALREIELDTVALKMYFITPV